VNSLALVPWLRVIISGRTSRTSSIRTSVGGASRLSKIGMNWLNTATHIRRSSSLICGTILGSCSVKTHLTAFILSYGSVLVDRETGSECIVDDVKPKQAHHQ
jgi:hypothetical protein